METLADALTQYAAENLIPRLQQKTAAQTRAACYEADRLTSQLKALGPEAQKWMEQLEKELLVIDTNYEQASLLAGISIGLKLGQL